MIGLNYLYLILKFNYQEHTDLGYCAKKSTDQLYSTHVNGKSSLLCPALYTPVIYSLSCTFPAVYFTLFTCYHSQGWKISWYFRKYRKYPIFLIYIRYISRYCKRFSKHLAHIFWLLELFLYCTVHLCCYLECWFSKPGLT